MIHFLLHLIDARFYILERKCDTFFAALDQYFYSTYSGENVIYFLLHFTDAPVDLERKCNTFFAALYQYFYSTY